MLIIRTYNSPNLNITDSDYPTLDIEFFYIIIIIIILLIIRVIKIKFEIYE
jgi:hypothetical protein